MPNPRNRMKGTGDTHPPEVEDDFGREDAGGGTAAPPAAAEGERGSAAAAAEREAPPEAAAPDASHDVLAAAREQVRAHPLAAVAGAFVLGMLLARI